MYHSLTFVLSGSVSDLEHADALNTWDDLHLIPSSRPTFSSPEVIARTIYIPGTNGILDISDAFTNTVMFNNREGSFEFIVMNDYEAWQHLYSKIMNRLHGRRVKILYEDDPYFYYQGRITVNEWRSEPDFSRIVLDYSIDPYKYSLTSSLEDWLWDPFDFEVGVVREYGNIEVESSTDISITVIGGRLYLSPVFRIKSGAHDLSVSINDGTAIETFELVGSTALTSDIVKEIYEYTIEDKEYTFTFSGTGTVGIDYREGSL